MMSGGRMLIDCIRVLDDSHENIHRCPPERIGLVVFVGGFTSRVIGNDLGRIRYCIDQVTAHTHAY